MHLIKEIFSSKWKYGSPILYVGILISFLLISYYNLSIGYIMSPDSFFYSKYVDHLIKLNFNIYNFYSQSTFINPNYTVTIPVLLMALSKSFFGIGWQHTFVIINLVLVLFSLILFSKSLLLLKVRPLVISLAMPVLTLSSDLLAYPRFILTDTIFAFFVVLLVFLIIKSIVKQKINYFSLVIVMIMIFITRPASIPYIFATCVFVFILLYQINYSSKLIILFISLLIILIPILLAFFHILMEHYLTDISQIKFILKYANRGIVVVERLETYVNPPPVTFFENIYFYFIKIINFFKYYASDFSTIHKILNVSQNMIIIFSIIILSSLKNSTMLINKTILFILLLSLSVASFHSLTIIDYDWRYRYPLLLPLIMLFPISIESFLRYKIVK